MISAVIAIVVAIITGGATIAAALIMARARPKPIAHELFIRFPTTPKKTSIFFKMFRPIGLGIVGLMVFVGINLITMTIFLWMDSSILGPSFDQHDKKLLSALFLVSAALLFCIARWGANRLKVDDEVDDNDDDDDDDDDDDE